MKIKTYFGTKGELPPEGVTTAIIQHVEEVISSKGNPMVVFTFEIKGYSTKYYCLNNGQNRWRIKDVIRAVSGKEPPTGEVVFDTDNLINKAVLVDIEHEDWNGKTRAKVKKVVLGEDIDYLCKEA